MSGSDRPKLRVIEGQGRARAAPGGELVVVAGARETRAERELAAAKAALAPLAPATLVYATLGALAPLGLRECLLRMGVRAIVDLRVEPSFTELGLQRRDFVEGLARLGIRYVHLQALCNRFTGESWHAEHYRIRLRAQYLQNRDAVVRLRQLVEDGPAVVLVAAHSAMEQDLLVRALERVAPGVGVECLAEL